MGSMGAPGGALGPTGAPWGPRGPRGTRGIDPEGQLASFKKNPFFGFLLLDFRPEKVEKKKVRPRPREAHGWIRAGIWCPGVVSDLRLVS